MALTHERNKSPRTRKGCILCYNMGAAAPTFAYVRVQFIPMYKNNNPVEKELGLCFKHCCSKGVLDREIGNWALRFGKQPIRDEVYELEGGPRNTKLLTGPAGMIPIWW